MSNTVVATSMEGRGICERHMGTVRGVSTYEHLRDNDWTLQYCCTPSTTKYQSEAAS